MNNVHTHTSKRVRIHSIERYCQNKNKHEHGLNIGHGAVWGTPMRTNTNTHTCTPSDRLWNGATQHNTAHRYDMRAQRIRIEKFDAHKHTSTHGSENIQTQTDNKYHWKIDHLNDFECCWVELTAFRWGTNFWYLNKKSSISKIVQKMALMKSIESKNYIFLKSQQFVSSSIFLLIYSNALGSLSLSLVRLTFGRSFVRSYAVCVNVCIFVYIKWHTDVCVYCGLRRSYERSCKRPCVSECSCVCKA